MSRVECQVYQPCHFPKVSTRWASFPFLLLPGSHLLTPALLSVISFFSSACSGRGSSRCVLLPELGPFFPPVCGVVEHDSHSAALRLDYSSSPSPFPPTFAGPLFPCPRSSHDRRIAFFVLASALVFSSVRKSYFLHLVLHRLFRSP